MTIVAVSAGHYPAKPGAAFYGAANILVLVEHTEALLWQAELAKQLRFVGLDVRIITPGTLGHKIDQVNRGPRCELAIEIHFNSAVNHHGQHIGNGSETLFAPNSKQGRYMGEAVQHALAQIFPPSRGTKEGWYRMDVPGKVDFAGDVEGDEVPDAFLVRTNCPALIIEPEFVHNYQAIRARRVTACAGMARAIKSCLPETEQSNG